MSSKRLWFVVSVLVLLAMLVAACGPTTPAVDEPAVEEPAAEEPAAAEPVEEAAPVVIGMLLVGPYNDHGWSEAHYNAGLYVTQNIPNTEFIYRDNVNAPALEGTTVVQVAEELMNRGATIIIFNSDDMTVDAHEFATLYPEITVIHASGDGAWVDGVNYQGFANLYNVMGRMEIGKMIAGCAAAMTTQTGQIGYLGPLINSETRRLAASVYLGARYCYETYRGLNPDDLQFRVTWIGFWFNIPGFTSDPTQVADEFINNGFDVVISGIDTTEAIVQAAAARANGAEVWAIPYDFVGACGAAPEACLGVPYFNWGPSYVETVNSIIDGTFQSGWDWLGPDWTDINNADTSMIGFEPGPALTGDAATAVDSFIAELAGGLNLWTGPVNLQDGTVYLSDGEVGTDYQVWYLPQLLEGMQGESVAAE